jgi:formylglycine-generating enzyme required for sulfatase activity
MDVPSTITLKGMEMIHIPASKFLMGSDEGKDNEKPPHEVYLDGFYIARHPVTNGQYEEFVSATGHDQVRVWRKETYRKGKENHPVVSVSWHDALAYCRWLSEETGEEMRLPTEAEWEKAARGTDLRRYPWGHEFDKSKCNTQESAIGGTTPVGKYSPRGDSPYGVADMAGNVWEWCSTRWGKGWDECDYPYPYEKDERENLEGEYSRLLRGGAWNYLPGAARCAARNGHTPASRYNHSGFRCARGSP